MGLERLGDIVHQGASNRQEDLEETRKRNSIVETEAEAREKGLVIPTPQPPDERCEFCGKVLHHEGVHIFGRVVAWNANAQRCDCEQAVKKWAEYDAEQERKKQEEEQLPNVRFLCVDAMKLADILGPGEAAKIYLNFSDPWPKDRHASSWPGRYTACPWRRTARWNLRRTTEVFLNILWNRSRRPGGRSFISPSICTTASMPKAM